MKNKIFFIIIGILLVCAGCKKEEIAPIAKVEVKDVLIDASYRKADVYWRVESNATTQAVVFEYSTDSAFEKAVKVPMSKVSAEKEGMFYKVYLDSLQEGTRYYARSLAYNKINSCASAAQVFETKPYELASISTDSITGITVSSAKLHATMHEWGADTMPQIGFCIATHDSVSIADSCLVYQPETNQDSMSYSIPLDCLADNTTYYLRAYAKNSKGVSYGEEFYFTTTEIVLPQVGNTTISDITYTTATATSEVISDGGASVTERGICYSTTQYPTITDNKIKNGTGLGSFTCALTNLAAGTIYYIRAYATNGKGTSYGDEASFTTATYGLPTVTTFAVTSISYTTATCGGEVTDDGGQSVIERGICYSTLANPTITDNKVKSGSGKGSFSGDLTNLAAGTTYFVRAYAINNKGTSYGDEVSFITTSYGLPIVTTSAVTNISYTTATCGGNVTGDGGLLITERGVCYSTFTNPTIADKRIVAGSGFGVFTCDLSGLKMGVSYYVRAYAINSKGITYGKEITFTTDISEYGALYYTANSKLPETAGTDYSSKGLHINSFNVSILSHDFEDGEGIIIFNGQLSKIGDYAFRGCDSLISVTIPNGVISIGKQVFMELYRLNSVTLPNSVTSIGDYAFGYCNKLALINIPNSLTKINKGTFYDCNSLSSLTIPNSVTSIEEHAFEYCRNITSIIVPNRVTKIGESAFNSCSSLTSVKIPYSVTSIGAYAFCYCSSLTSVTIPDRVTSILWMTFSGCSGLLSLTIPNSVTSIEYGAFDGCTSLASIICKAINPPSLDNNGFRNVPKSIPLYVPTSSISAYQQASGWKEFTNIQPISE